MDDLIEKYNKSAEEYAKSQAGTESNADLNKLKSLLNSGNKVIDVGCAAGRDTRILKDMGFEVIGVDLAEKLLEIARKNNPDIEFAVADMRDLPFENSSFYAVWASAILHHLDKSEMPQALEEFLRVLIPGGILYIYTKVGEGRLRTQEASVNGETRDFELITP